MRKVALESGATRPRSSLFSRALRLGIDTRILLLVLAIGALLRGLYLAEIVHSPSFSVPQLDAAYNDYWARALVSGDWTPPAQRTDPQIRTTPFFRPPGYPYFLALIYAVTGSSGLAARVVQMGIGLGCAALAFLFGRRWFGERTGYLFAGLMAMYWGFIYFEGELLEPALMSLLGLLLLGALARLTERLTFARALFAGLLLGVSALVRPTMLAFAPVVALWAIWVFRDRARSATATLGLLVGTCGAIAPATLRNAWVAGDFVLISSNGGINLLLGNHPGANGTISPSLAELGAFQDSFEYPKIVAAVEAKVGHPLKHSEVSAYLTARALHDVAQRPRAALERTWRKALLFWGPSEVGNNKEDDLERAHSAILSRIPGDFALVVALFLAGALVVLKSRKALAATSLQVCVLTAAFVLTTFLAYLPYFAAGRFRMPLVPFLMVFGAIGLDRAVSLVQERKWRPLTLAISTLLVIYGVASRNFAQHEPNRDKWHFDRGVGLARTGKLDAAIAEYRAALAIRPQNAAALFNLGSILDAKADTAGAISLYERACALEPGNAVWLRALGTALARRGDTQRALEQFRAALLIERSPGLYVAIGDVLLRQEKDEEAVQAYRHALELDPRYIPAHNNLAVLSFMRGDDTVAWRHVELCRKYGGRPPAAFIEALEKRRRQPKP